VGRLPRISPQYLSDRDALGLRGSSDVSRDIGTFSADELRARVCRRDGALLDAGMAMHQLARIYLREGKVATARVLFESAALDLYNPVSLLQLAHMELAGAGDKEMGLPRSTQAEKRAFAHAWAAMYVAAAICSAQKEKEWQDCEPFQWLMFKALGIADSYEQSLLNQREFERISPDDLVQAALDELMQGFAARYPTAVWPDHGPRRAGD
jgi:hypothetical protein